MKRLRPLFVAMIVIMATVVWPAIAADNIMFIFDASNSMNKPFDGGETRFATAASAMSELMTSLPTDVNAGLMLYGWRIISYVGWMNSQKAEFITFWVLRFRF